MISHHLTSDLSILSHSENNGVILDIERSEDYFLILGPNITQSPNQTSYSLFLLLEDMISWCIRKKIINGYNAIDDFYEKYSKKSLISAKMIQLGYTLEENLSEKLQQQACLKAVLESHILPKEIYQLLAYKSFRGYISTAYDTFIETACAKKIQKNLSKFYAPSIDGAIEACRNRQPFILKLYGDIDEPASIVLGPRFIKGFSGVCEQKRLRVLLSMAPALLIGFEGTDPDLEMFRKMATFSEASTRIATPWSLSSSVQAHEFQVQHTQQIPAYDIICSSSQNYIAVTPSPQILSSLSTAIRASPHIIVGQETRSSPARTQAQNASSIEVFTAYVPTDEPIRKGIATILIALKNQGWNLIDSWGNATVPQECENNNHLETAHLILLLISINFLATAFCVSDQIKEAIERPNRGERCQIIPIIARAVSPLMLQDTCFGHLPFLPLDGKPVIKKKDSALAEIGDHIRRILESWRHY